MKPLFICFATTALLSACAKQEPISVENAQVICTEKARESTYPVSTDVSVGVGVGSGGRTRSGVGITIGANADQLSGKNPEQIYRECVQKRSGQPPKSPLQL